ncbi:MAG: hypothetical protein RR661_00725 [Anaerovoracaceae bacterium]
MTEIQTKMVETLAKRNIEKGAVIGITLMIQTDEMAEEFLEALAEAEKQQEVGQQWMLLKAALIAQDHDMYDLG